MVRHVLAVDGWACPLLARDNVVFRGDGELPELAKGLGRGLRLFKNEVRGVKDD